MVPLPVASGKKIRLNSLQTGANFTPQGIEADSLAGYCSICFARKPAAVSASFCSVSDIVMSGSREQRMTAPIGSPPETIGAIT